MANPNALQSSHHAFGQVGPASHQLTIFHVSPGIDAIHALNKASDLLAEVQQLLLDAAMGEPMQGSKAWLTCHAVESAKAIVDSLCGPSQHLAG